MKFIEGTARRQTHLFPVSIEASIDPDNDVRLIDLFVDSLILSDYGFKTDFTENGRLAIIPVIYSSYISMDILINYVLPVI